MEPDRKTFLTKLLNTAGPSGFESAPARVWRAEAEQFAQNVTVDVGGNSYASINDKGKPRVMMAGHIDEIGVMVVHIDEEGFLFFNTIGGWDSQVLVGQRVELIGRHGTVFGVVGKRAIHLIKMEDRTKISKTSDLWIDIGVKSREEALERVRVGDAGVLTGTTLDLPGGRIASRSIDNRIGAFIVLEALRDLAADPPSAAVHAVATTREEIAWTGGGAKTGAVSLDPTAALVVDVTHATDFPGAEKKESGDFKLGCGPVLSRGSAVNPVVFDLLVEAAEAEGIPYGISAAPKDTGTDADAIHSVQRGVATGLVSIPNRYMHSPSEMIDLADVEAAAKLLSAFCRRLTAKTDFVPR